MVAVGGIGLVLLARRLCEQLRHVGSAKFVRSSRTTQFATFIFSATVGSFAIELVYLVLAVAAFRLVRSSGNKPWQYAIVAVAVATPILGFYGALNPEPHDTLELQLGRRLLDDRPAGRSPLIWFVIVLVTRRDKVDNAASHAAEHHGVAPLDETLGFEPAGETTPL